MRIFKDMELVEQLGSGIPRILQFYGRECFKFSDNYTRMSFPVENVTEKRSIQIIDLMLKNPLVTTEQIAKVLSVSKRTIIRDVDKLKDKGQIEYIGSAKGGYWKVIK